MYKGARNHCFVLAGRDRVGVRVKGGGGILLLERYMEISHRFVWNSRDQFASATLMI